MLKSKEPSKDDGKELPKDDGSSKTSFDYMKYVTGTGSVENPFQYKDPAGNIYIFDPLTNDWKQQELHPAILFAQQQSIYGKPNNTAQLKSQKQLQVKDQNSTADQSETPIDKAALDAAEEKKRRKKEKKKKAFKNKDHTNIYVTGLPSDITLQEVVDFFSKCGLIKKDPETAESKIKLYKDEQGNLKGDALISYYRKESVDLALQLLDGSEFRPGSGKSIAINRAVFEQKENIQPQQKKRPSKKVKLYNQAKDLSWDEDDNVHVVLKNMFDQNEAWNSPTFFEELEEEILKECEKKRASGKSEDLPEKS